jgi:hypothetical protein
MITGLFTKKTLVGNFTKILILSRSVPSIDVVELNTYPFPTIFRADYVDSKDRTLFEFPYPKVLTICEQQHIHCLWIFSTNTYDSELLERYNKDWKFYDIIRFKTASDAIKIKLIYNRE